MEILKKIADAFSVSEDEVKNKLNITNDSDSKQIAKALGVYGLFQEKNEIENYIKSKVQNKIIEIEKLQAQLEESKNKTIDFEKVNNELKSKLSNISAQIKKQFDSEWANLKLPKTDFEDIKFVDLNLQDLKNEVLKIAKSKKLSPEILQPQQIQKLEDIATFRNGSQSFEIGARRVK
ncbi:hypothetical protein ACT1UH_02945 [Mycoplasma sp. 332]|uniref:hypothetical protein n=1 Tax=Mycoplasma sp. 332 TaxID=3458236 RepID=UPI0040350766